MEEEGIAVERGGAVADAVAVMILGAVGDR